MRADRRQVLMSIVAGGGLIGSGLLGLSTIIAERAYARSGQTLTVLSGKVPIGGFLSGVRCRSAFELVAMDRLPFHRVCGVFRDLDDSGSVLGLLPESDYVVVNEAVRSSGRRIRWAAGHRDETGSRTRHSIIAGGFGSSTGQRMARASGLGPTGSAYSVNTLTPDRPDLDLDHLLRQTSGMEIHWSSVLGTLLAETTSGVEAPGDFTSLHRGNEASSSETIGHLVSFVVTV